MPVVIVYRYNGGSRISISVSERGEHEQESWRADDRIGKVATLQDINLAAPSEIDLSLLESLRNPEVNTSSIVTVTTSWRERLRLQDTDYLLEVAQNWIEEHESFPPIEKFGEIFGNSSITTIRNYTGWGTYADFLGSVYGEEKEEPLQGLLKDLVLGQVTQFHTRYGFYPAVSVIRTYNRYQDLGFFGESQAQEILDDVVFELGQGEEIAGCPLTHRAQKVEACIIDCIPIEIEERHEKKEESSETIFKIHTICIDNCSRTLLESNNLMADYHEDELDFILDGGNCPEWLYPVTDSVRSRGLLRYLQDKVLSGALPRAVDLYRYSVDDFEKIPSVRNSRVEEFRKAKLELPSIIHAEKTKMIGKKRFKSESRVNQE